MKLSQFTYYQLKYLYAALFLLVFLFVLRTGPIFFTDTSGYLEMSLMRSVGYPAFVAIHKLIFGSYSLEVLIATQMMLIGWSAHFLSRNLAKFLSLNEWISLIIFSLLLIPCVYEIKVANSILSEGIAYPLYLFIVAQILLFISKQNSRNFYYGLMLLFILICVRSQFLFVLPVLLLISIFLFKTKKIIPVFCTILIFPLAVLTDILYHKTVHGYAVTTPWTGIQTVTIPFFVSDKNDASVLQDPNQRIYFNLVRQRLSEKQLLLENVPEEINETEFFYNNYTKICNSTIQEEGQEFLANSLTEAEKLIQNDQMTKSITLPLLKQNFKKWLGVYFKNFNRGLSSSKIMLIYLTILLFSALAFFRNRQNKTAQLFVVLVSLTFANVALVALVEPATSRYVFYNNWILITIVIYLLTQFFKTKTDE